MLIRLVHCVYLQGKCYPPSVAIFVLNEAFAAKALRNHGVSSELLLTVLTQFLCSTPLSRIQSRTGIDMDVISALYAMNWQQALWAEAPLAKAPRRRDDAVTSVPAKAPIPSDLLQAVEGLLKLKLTLKDIQAYMHMDGDTFKRAVDQVRGRQCDALKPKKAVGPASARFISCAF